ncbi:hypothetical protein ACCO45_001129 [Purpureocillium lilacinum]|uniref:Uncharacterized protein n=1 Tax=Purpureocillium lilacinum TaxID=33203 RepID=A0ACC4E644_PURLI
MKPKPCAEPFARVILDPHGPGQMPAAHSCIPTVTRWSASPLRRRDAENTAFQPALPPSCGQAAGVAGEARGRWGLARERSRPIPFVLVEQADCHDEWRASGAGGPSGRSSNLGHEPCSRPEDLATRGPHGTVWRNLVSTGGSLLGHRGGHGQWPPLSALTSQQQGPASWFTRGFALWTGDRRTLCGPVPAEMPCIHGSQAEIGSTARGAQRSVALLCARPLRVHSIGVMKSNGTFVAREERAVRKASLGRIEPTSSGARSLAERRR